MKQYVMSCMALLLLAGCGYIQPRVETAAQPDREIIYQYSTIDALLQANYQSVLTFGELSRHGDFGIGTFHELDGEMVALDGMFYQIRSDGKAYPVRDEMTTPFAAVTFFDADNGFDIGVLDDYQSLVKLIDALLPTANLFYAVKIEGVFSRIKVRSVPRQTQPYQPLAEVVKGQPVYIYDDVQGTLVGFRCPAYVKGINVPGYHLHFISQDKTYGGHVLDFSIQSAKLTLDRTHGFEMLLPDNQEFYETPLGEDQTSALEKVEK